MMKVKMRALFVTVLMLCLSMVAGAEEVVDGRIQGIVMDGALGEPMSFVTVQVKEKGADKILKGTVTGNDGVYIISGLKPGDYVITYSYVGYSEISKTISIKSENQVLRLGKLTLEEDTNQLNEVELVGQKPQMRFELDRKIFDATQDISSEGGSASDLLSNIPSIEVDNEGTVSLRGNSSVTIWINGKASGLTSDNQSDILEMMPAEDIKQVEVITNPSAKYSPEGTAGIINIVLKDDRTAGYYGSVKVGADSQGGYQAGGNINYSSGKWDAFANISYRNREDEGGGVTTRENLSESTFLNQNTSSDRQNGNWFGRFGLTWHITRNDDLSFTSTLMKGDGENDQTIHYLSTNSDGSTIYTSDRNTFGDTDSKMYNIELNYFHKFSNKSDLDITVSHNKWDNDRFSIYQQTTEYTDPSTTVSPVYQTQQTDTENKTWEVQADYSNRLTDFLRLEAGYKGTFQRNESPVDTYTGTTVADIVQDQTLYNRFLYNQDIHALYLTFGGRWGNLNYQAGLRGEYWKVDTHSLSYDQEFNGEASEKYKSDYFKLFPSAFLSYTLPHDNELQINYTRRLRRPFGNQLNSFRDISDASNISFGNPELTPEYSHAFEMNYIKTWQSGHMLSLSGYYRSTDDVIQRISYLSTAENVMYTTSENIARSQSSGMEIVGKNRLFRILDLTTTVNLYYSKLDGFSYWPEGSETEVTSDTDESFSWSARMIARFSLPWGISLQATGNYTSKRLVAQGYRKPNYSVDLGLRKSFMKGKWTLSVNARDLFETRKFRTITHSSTFYQDAESWRSGRRIGFTLTFNFGNMNKSKSRLNQDFDDSNMMQEEETQEIDL